MTDISQLFPPRTKYTRWDNPEPFTDIHAVLELLNSDSPTYEPNHLDRSSEPEFEWEIIVPWYTHGDSGGDDSGHNYFQVDPSLAKQLITEGLVEQRRIPRMGHTDTRENEFVISQVGKERLREFETEMRKKAESLLVPGIHTDLTGKPEYRGHSRDHWRYGNLYYKYEMPTGGHCRVYPETEVIELPSGTSVVA